MKRGVYKNIIRRKKENVGRGEGYISILLEERRKMLEEERVV